VDSEREEEDSLPGQMHGWLDSLQREAEEKLADDEAKGVGSPTISASTRTTSSGVPTRPPAGTPECWRPTAGCSGEKSLTITAGTALRSAWGTGAPHGLSVEHGPNWLEDI